MSCICKNASTWWLIYKRTNSYALVSFQSPPPPKKKNSKGVKWTNKPMVSMYFLYVYISIPKSVRVRDMQLDEYCKLVALEIFYYLVRTCNDNLIFGWWNHSFLFAGGASRVAFTFEHWVGLHGCGNSLAVCRYSQLLYKRHAIVAKHCRHQPKQLEHCLTWVLYIL